MSGDETRLAEITAEKDGSWTLLRGKRTAPTSLSTVDRKVVATSNDGDEKDKDTSPILSARLRSWDMPSLVLGAVLLHDDRAGRDGANRQVWIAEIADGVQARAYWRKKEKGKEINLEFICIMNDPDLGAGG